MAMAVYTSRSAHPAGCYSFVPNNESLRRRRKPHRGAVTLNGRSIGLHRGLQSFELREQFLFNFELTFEFTLILLNQLDFRTYIFIPNSKFTYPIILYIFNQGIH